MKKGEYILTTRRASNDTFGDTRTFYRNTLVRFSLVTVFLLQVLSFSIVLFFVRSQQSIVIVHYNVYFGVDLIGDWEQIFIAPVITLVFAGVNILLAQWFYGQKDRVASYMLLLTSILISFGSVLACASTALINY